MKTSTKRILLILFVSLLLLSLTRFVFDIFKIKEYIYVIILGSAFLCSILLLGYTKNRNSKEKNMTLAILIFTLLFQTLTFVILGLKLGFLSSSYHLGYIHLFQIVLPLIFIIVLSEVLRRQWIEKGRNSKLVLVAVTIFFIILDILMGSSLYSLNTFKSWFELLASIIFPSIMKNILLSYIAYYYGEKPNLVYRIIMELPIYYLPIVPDLGNYLNSILNISFPFLLLIYLISYTSNTEICSKDSEEKQSSNHNVKFLLNTIFLLFIFIFTALMSGMFKYYLLVVGSGSMEPNIQVGDMVLVEKTKDYQKLKIGDVLVYKNRDKVVVHRIKKIKKENQHFVFKTQGDHNKAMDTWDIKEKDVIGKVNFKIQKIGYPTIWLNELFKGGN